MKTLLTRSLLLGLLFTAGGVLAQATSTPPLPEWDKLTPQQREAPRCANAGTATWNNVRACWNTHNAGTA